MPAAADADAAVTADAAVLHNGGGGGGAAGGGGRGEASAGGAGNAIKSDIAASSSSSSSPMPSMSPSSSSSSASNVRVASQQQQLQSGQVDSPLRQALGTLSPPEKSSSSTPLLKASLSSPPVAHAVAQSTSATTSSSSSLGTVDLSLRPRGGDEAKSTGPSYASNLLLFQLGQQQPQSGFAPSSSVTIRGFPSSEAARKKKAWPKSTSSPAANQAPAASAPSGSGCFPCPACKKRFQRHIAMSAHFQNEHIGSTSAGDGGKKVCRLCSQFAARYEKGLLLAVNS